MTFAFECAAGTHRGCVRKRNEDSHLCDRDSGVFAVADGMGGEAAGDYASRCIVAELAGIGRADSAEELLRQTKAGLDRAHRHLRGYAEARDARVVGATVVVLLVHEGYVACVWSGDSRLYRLRDGRLAQLSRDHNEVGELVERGAISRADARTWRGRNAVTRAVGVHEALETETLYGDLRTGDTFLLCSDGLTHHVEDEEIRDILRRHALEPAVDALIGLALERGGEDNVTVVLVRTGEPEMRTVLQPPWRPS